MPRLLTFFQTLTFGLFQAAPEEEELPPELSSVDADSMKPCFTPISFLPTQSPPPERNVSDLLAVVRSSIAHDVTVNFSQQ